MGLKKLYNSRTDGLEIEETSPTHMKLWLALFCQIQAYEAISTFSSTTSSTTLNKYKTWQQKNSVAQKEKSTNFGAITQFFFFFFAFWSMW